MIPLQSVSYSSVTEPNVLTHWLAMVWVGRPLMKEPVITIFSAISWNCPFSPLSQEIPPHESRARNNSKVIGMACPNPSSC